MANLWTRTPSSSHLQPLKRTEATGVTSAIHGLTFSITQQDNFLSSGERHFQTNLVGRVIKTEDKRSGERKKPTTRVGGWEDCIDHQTSNGTGSRSFFGKVEKDRLEWALVALSTGKWSWAEAGTGTWTKLNWLLCDLLEVSVITGRQRAPVNKISSITSQSLRTKDYYVHYYTKVFTLLRNAIKKKKKKKIKLRPQTLQMPKADSCINT